MSVEPVPNISIILPVYNGGAYLRFSLGAIAASDYRSFECIVVDDSSTDGGRTLIAGFPMSVRIVDLEEGPRGPAYARNRGAEVARGAILFFLDADVVLAPGALRRVANVFQEQADLVAVFGSYDARPAAPGVISQYRNLLHHFVHQNSNPDASTFWAGCGAIRRSVFQEIGGFDEKRFPRPSIEDIELGYRLRRRGERILLDKELQGTHLKQWRLCALIRTDIACRAMPWSRLLLETKQLPNDLNLNSGQRLSLVMVALACACLMIAVVQPRLLALSALALLTVIVINRPLYGFFFRQRGVFFATACIPLHLLYYLYSGLSYFYVWSYFQLRRVAKLLARLRCRTSSVPKAQNHETYSDSQQRGGPRLDKIFLAGLAYRQSTSTGLVQSFVARQRRGILLIAVTLMGVFAIPWLSMNIIKLLLEQGPWGAVDLKFRYNEVQLWFDGMAVYTEQSQAMHAVYPPASYTILWPLIGWLEFPYARIVFAASMAAALGSLAFMFVKASGADTRLERAFVMLLLLSMYATGFAFGHGQLTIFCLWGLVAGLTLISSDQRRWQDDLIAAFVTLIAMVKPTLFVPFFWLVLFRPMTLRPALLIVFGYIILTLFAMTFQEFDLPGVLGTWLSRTVEAAARESAAGGYGNIHSWLAIMGLQQWNPVASLVLLLALGYWTYQHRHADLWLLLGVTAIVARLWVYHRSYDDMLVLLPMIALFRIVKQGSSNNGSNLLASLLLALAVMIMFVPALLFIFPASKSLVKNSQSLVPIMLLMFLLYWGWREQAAKKASYRLSRSA